MLSPTARNRRAGIRLDTLVTARAYRDGHALRAKVMDISASGALIRLQAQGSLPLVQRLELELETATLCTLARTVWQRGDVHAVRFIDLSDVDRLDIAEHLDIIERHRRIH